MQETRQLAAIMFTDIVGYTALMGSDEEKAFELLRKNREIQKPVIEKYNGRWIKELGDGVMSSFNAVSDAVHAAVEIQRICNKSKDFQLRIGIHLGEVIFEDDDVFGDGVNIASRIQAMAHPGSVFVSETVHNNVNNKKDIVTQFVKIQKLKNVKEPIRIYQVIADGIAKVKPPVKKLDSRVKIALTIVAGSVILVFGIYFKNKFTSKVNSQDSTALNEKSIAILPFIDLSPDKGLQYLTDGLASEIINSISIIKGLRVIGSTTSFKYKGKGMNARQIGEELDVNHVLEGSIQQDEQNLRITIRLINVKKDSTVWSQKFDKELKGIFAIQDSISNNIVQKLKITLSDSESSRLTKKETDPEVYALYLKGLLTYVKSEFDKSIEYNTQAIKLDSQFAPSYAYIALSKIWKIVRSRAFTDFNAISEAKEFARKAVSIDPTLAEGYSSLALMAWTIELDFAAAKLNFEKSIQLNPSASLIKNRYGYFLIWMGDFDKAEKMAIDAINLDPGDYNGYLIAAWVKTYKKEFKKAQIFADEGNRLFPERSGFTYANALIKFYSGNYNEVVKLLSTPRESDSIDPDDLLVFLCLSYFKKGDINSSKRILEELRKKSSLSVSGNHEIHYSLARIYAQYQMIDSCFVNLEKAFANREGNFRILKIDPLLEPVKKDSRYKDLYHRYGFDRYK